MDIVGSEFYQKISIFFAKRKRNLVQTDRVDDIMEMTQDDEQIDGYFEWRYT